jgi:hypothetical protein
MSVHLSLLAHGTTGFELADSHDILFLNFFENMVVKFKFY